MTGGMYFSNISTHNFIIIRDYSTYQYQQDYIYSW